MDCMQQLIFRKGKSDLDANVLRVVGIGWLLMSVSKLQIKRR